MNMSNTKKIFIFAAIPLTAAFALFNVVKEARLLKDYRKNQDNIKKFSASLSEKNIKTVIEEPINEDESKNDSLSSSEIEKENKEQTFFLKLGSNEGEIEAFSKDYNDYLSNIIQELNSNPTILLEIEGSTYGLGARGTHNPERGTRVMIGEEILKLGKKANLV